ncbi:MAG: hypothetical protein IT462_09985 [Planctomycetes bacterium]|nr:hypothetical protein [Planctomycetota bacterium]
MADAPADMKVTEDIAVTEALKQTTRRVDRIVIHPYSKIMTMWPLVLMSVVFYFLGGGWWAVNRDAEALVSPSALGWWWLILFFFSMLVQTFDFGRTNFLATVSLIAVALMGLWIWDLQSPANIYGDIYAFLRAQQVQLHPNFYLIMAAGFAVLFLFALVASRFNYWVLEPNRLMHKHGLLGDERQYATMNMTVEKEIPDVFEYIVFRSGRLVFKPGVGADSHKVLVLDNVFNISKVESRVREFLGIIKVDEDRTR